MKLMYEGTTEYTQTDSDVPLPLRCEFEGCLQRYKNKTITGFEKRLCLNATKDHIAHVWEENPASFPINQYNYTLNKQIY